MHNVHGKIKFKEYFKGKEVERYKYFVEELTFFTSAEKERPE